MGLDMYLSRKIYIGANYEHRNVKGVINLTHGDNNEPIKINFNKVSYIEEEAAYWRKSNQIHNWFVENIQNGIDDCREYYVSVEKLQELVDLCKKDIEYLNSLEFTLSEEKEDLFTKEKFKYKIFNNIEEDKLNLPTQSGFFFGSTEYDEYYYNDLKETVETLEQLLNDGNKYEYYYQSSW